MIYVFDTSSLHSLKHVYPTVFKGIWSMLEELTESGELISTREVFKELQGQDTGAHVKQWAKVHKSLFGTPTNQELLFVSEIFKVPHFQNLIGVRQRLKGMPVADPFVIACARVHGGTVVTEEGLKPNAAKIPNVCAHFKTACINLEGFMQQQGWAF